MACASHVWVGWVVGREHVAVDLDDWLGTKLSVEGCGSKSWVARVWSIVVVGGGG